MFTSCQAAIILEVHVTFNYIDENGENQMHMVNNHSSWQMTKLLIYPITLTNYCTPFHIQHQAIRELVAVSLLVVNGNGGWDVIGWCCRGIWEHEIVERRSTKILVIFTIFYQKCTIVNIRLD
jgi:hypothetical protein